MHEEGLPDNLSNRKMIKKYRKLLNIPDHVHIDLEMIQKHWNLETELAGRLMKSTPEKRWETARFVYTRFYHSLPWLNETDSLPHESKVREDEIIDLAGPPPLKIYEVGSGTGELIYRLAETGHECRGCEITAERGERRSLKHPRLSYGMSDGVHLNRFEKENQYDLLISSNVIEHLHPDDLLIHLRSAARILRKGGRYIVKTPHAFFGPHGIESLLGLRRHSGLHLKEYCITDFWKAAGPTGFARIETVFVLPNVLRKIIGRESRLKTRSSDVYTSYLLFLESIVRFCPSDPLKRALAFLLRFIKFPRNVFIVLFKPDGW